MTAYLLRNAEVEGDRVDIRVIDGMIDEVKPGLVPRGERQLDLGGGAVLPGLHDHHIHLLALAAAQSSVEVGPPSVATADQLAATLRSAGGTGLVRAVGYHESVAGDLDRDALDALAPGRPVRVQHRSGALWVLNSPALDSLDFGSSAGDEPPGVERDAAGRLTGRFWRVDAWLRDRLPEGDPPSLAAVGDLLLRYGVTGVTDATPSDDLASLRLLGDAVRRGELVPRVVATGSSDLIWQDVPGIERGPVKILLPDHEDPSFDRMLASVRAARAQDRAVAVHAVTAATAALVVAVLDEVGPMAGDRIEHGAVLPIGLVARLAEMGISVVTNPGFVSTRGEQYLTDVDADERPDLWRCRSLHAAGVSVGAGTDAPFGNPNPWRAMATAVDRRTAAGRPLGPDESVTPPQALDLFLGALDRPGGPARRVAIGEPADLCILDSPLAHALADLAKTRPAMTIAAGTIHAW